MTDAELLSLLQFNQRWATRTLPASLSTQGELQHLLGLYAGVLAGEAVIAYFPPRFTITRQFIGTADIHRQNVHTANIERLNVGINEK